MPTVKYNLSWVCPRVSIQWDLPDTVLAWANQGQTTGSSEFKGTVSLLWTSPCRVPNPIREIKPSNPAEEPHFHCLYLWPYFFQSLPTACDYIWGSTGRLAGEQQALSENSCFQVKEQFLFGNLIMKYLANGSQLAHYCWLKVGA